jgi:hypothetical protein
MRAGWEKSYRASRRVLQLFRKFADQRFRPPNPVQLGRVEETAVALSGSVLEHLIVIHTAQFNKEKQFYGAMTYK